MSRITPKLLAKTGLVLFAPVEIVRLALDIPISPWVHTIVWLGQGLVVAAAGWKLIADPGTVRIIRAVCGLMFFMVPVWPWFTLLHWELNGVTTTALEQGVSPADYPARAAAVLSDYTLLSLIEAPKATFAATPHGCATQHPGGWELVIVNSIPASTRALIWAMGAVVGAVSLVGAAVGAANLFREAKTPLDRGWVIAGALALAMIMALLAARAPGVGPCAPPSEILRAHRVEFRTGVILHPFGAMLLAAALALSWWWPRSYTARKQRLAAFRDSIAQG